MAHEAGVLVQSIGLRAGIQPMLLKLAVGAPETQPSPILGGRVMTPGSLRYGRTSRTSLAIIPWRGRLKVLRTKRSRGIGAQSEPMAWRGWLSCLVLGILLCCCSTSSAGRRNMAPSTNPSATGAQPAPSSVRRGGGEAPPAGRLGPLLHRLSLALAGHPHRLDRRAGDHTQRR